MSEKENAWTKNEDKTTTNFNLPLPDFNIFFIFTERLIRRSHKACYLRV